MTINRKSIGQFVCHLMTGIIFNLVAAVLVVNAYFAQGPTQRLAAGVRIVLACWVLTFAVNVIKRYWANVRHVGYYFLPTMVIFWVLDERRRRVIAEAGTARVKEIISSWPDTSIDVIAGIVEPERQRETLTKMLAGMDSMRDSYLATLTDRIRRYLGLILKSVEQGGNYHLFKQVMWRLAAFEPDNYRLTYKRCLALLSDVFDPTMTANFGRTFQKEMTGPLKIVIAQAGRAHAGRVRSTIAKIMADDGTEHEVPIRVAEMLLQLDWAEDRQMCRVIFDESLKRAFRFPRGFGIELLNILNRLEHKVFWLDTESLRSLLAQSATSETEGLINTNRQLFRELSSKVLAPLEDPAFSGICSGRVFRRLKHDDGRVGIECVWGDGQTCSCLGESLSFRGVYSKDCRKQVGEKLDMNITPIRELERRFAVKAAITPLHTYESVSQGPGRGAFFEDAEPTEVKGLYDYVSTKP
ncbi:MAG: hypothetical protein ACYTE3_20265 [Planctomycetota bacterium]